MRNFTSLTKSARNETLISREYPSTAVQRGYGLVPHFVLSELAR